MRYNRMRVECKISGPVFGDGEGVFKCRFFAELIYQRPKLGREVNLILLLIICLVRHGGFLLCRPCRILVGVCRVVQPEDGYFVWVLPDLHARVRETDFHQVRIVWLPEGPAITASITSVPPPKILELLLRTVLIEL